MTHQIKHFDTFKVTGLKTRTINTDEMNPDTAKIGQLWRDFFGRDLIGSLEARVPSTPIYGVYANYESDQHGQYDITAGVQVTANHELEDDLETIDIVTGDYMIFETKGDMPQRIIDGWMAVWAYFDDKNAPFERLYTTDFEQMIDENDIKIFIAVKAK